MATIKGIATLKVWTEEEIARDLFRKRVLDVSLAYHMAVHAPRAESKEDTL